MVELAQELRTRLEQWLRATHPDLLVNPP